MKTNHTPEKEMAYCYPSSISALRLGFDKEGCWAIKLSTPYSNEYSYESANEQREPVMVAFMKHPAPVARHYLAFLVRNENL